MSNGLIRTWMLDSGSAWAEPWQAHDADIAAVGWTTGAGLPVIVSGGGHDGTVRIWSVTGGSSRP